MNPALPSGAPGSGAVGHGVADEGRVSELLEADDQCAADGEVVGDAGVEVLAGGFVDGGVAGEDDDVLAVDDVGVVVSDPLVPVLGQRLHDGAGDALGSAVGAGQQGEAGRFLPFHVRGQGRVQRLQVAGGGGEVLAAYHVGGCGAGGEVRGG